ncbi:hypothetical protein CJO94_22730 (plasmid) [Ralstonia solanacearum]|nr:hypothetical protein CJO94_22730 [Ralstonia solanacearum]
MPIEIGILAQIERSERPFEMAQLQLLATGVKRDLVLRGRIGMRDAVRMIGCLGLQQQRAPGSDPQPRCLPHHVPDDHQQIADLTIRPGRQGVCLGMPVDPARGQPDTPHRQPAQCPAQDA